MKSLLHGKHDEAGGHGLIPMLLSCGLMLGLLLLLTWTDAAWSGPLILAALVLCLGTMVVMGLTAGRSDRSGKGEGHEDHQ